MSASQLSPELDVAVGAGAADAACALLAEPGLGVTRIAYVGLREREAVHLLLDARDSGLEAQAARGAGGQVSIKLAARAEPAASVATAAPAVIAATRRPVGWQRAWARLWTRGLGFGRRPAGGTDG